MATLDDIEQKADRLLRLASVEGRTIDGSGGGGNDGGMDARIAKLEAIIPTLATKEDLARLDGSLRTELHKVISEQTWKVVTWTSTIGVALVAAVFFIARNVK